MNKPQTMQRWLYGALLACLTLWLTACASTTPVIVTKLKPVAPPASMTAPTPAPQPPANGANNDALETYAAELRTALAQANADKARVRAFADGASAASGGGGNAAVPGAVAPSLVRPTLRQRLKQLWKGSQP